MLWWLLGVVVGAVVGVCIGSWVGKKSDDRGLGFGAGLLAVILLCVLVSLPSSIRIINPGEAGVQMAFGSFTGDPLSNGTHMVAPWVSVIKYTTKIQQYTMDHNSSEGQVEGDDSIPVLCKDRLSMAIDATCFWSVEVEKLNWIHTNLGPDYIHGFLRPIIRKAIPEVFGNQEGMVVSTTGREQASKDAFIKLAPEFRKMGMKLLEVNLRNIQPPQTVSDAISAKLAAVETAKKAEFEAQGLVAKAKGEAEANKLRQVSLTPLLVQWEQIQVNKAMADSKNAKLVIIPAGTNPNMIVQP